MPGLMVLVLFSCLGYCEGHAVEAFSEVIPAQATQEDPFVSTPRSEDALTESKNDKPFPPVDGSPMTDCGPSSTLARAEFRKPELAQALCEGRFTDLDKEWLFILNYVRGFNEFLEERGSFLDPTGKCSRAVEPRATLSLIYEVIDRVLAGDLTLIEDARLQAMLEPFWENPWKLPLLIRELNVWKREGALDATSVASLGMCGDPAFLLFWQKAIEYIQRVPGVDP